MSAIARVLFAVALVASLVVIPLESPGAPQSSWVADPACERGEGADLEAVAAHAATFDAVGQTETQGYLLWLDNEPAQAAVRRISEVVDRHPGTLFGYYGDFLLQAVVVTVEPTESDPLRFLPELQEAAGSAVTVILRPACRTRAELKVIEEALLTRDWFSSRASLNWGFYVDASNSRIVVNLPGEATAEAASLTARFGEAIEIRAGGPEFTGRMDDGSPHYGGAAIGGYNNSFCTAGFAMDLYGGRWMVTAGHCTRGYDPLNWYSGPKYYGYERDEHEYYDEGLDVMLLGSGSETYARIIHTDPPTGHTRTVTAKADPVILSTVCISGKISKAWCSIVVQSVHWTGDVEEMHYEDVAWGWRAGPEVINVDGDSGAPIYQQLPNNTARIVGMNVAGYTSEQGGGPSPQTTIFLKPSQIEAITGAVVATTCCTDTSW
jgi:hypothetical protein